MTIRIFDYRAPPLSIITGLVLLQQELPLLLRFLVFALPLALRKAVALVELDEVVRHPVIARRR